MSHPSSEERGGPYRQAQSCPTMYGAHLSYQSLPCLLLVYKESRPYHRHSKHPLQSDTPACICSNHSQCRGWCCAQASGLVWGSRGSPLNLEPLSPSSSMSPQLTYCSFVLGNSVGDPLTCRCDSQSAHLLNQQVAYFTASEGTRPINPTVAMRLCPVDSSS